MVFPLFVPPPHRQQEHIRRLRRMHNRFLATLIILLSLTLFVSWRILQTAQATNGPPEKVEYRIEDP